MNIVTGLFCKDEQALCPFQHFISLNYKVILEALTPLLTDPGTAPGARDPATGGSPHEEQVFR